MLLLVHNLINKKNVPDIIVVVIVPNSVDPNISNCKLLIYELIELLHLTLTLTDLFDILTTSCSKLLYPFVVKLLVSAFTNNPG